MDSFFKIALLIDYDNLSPKQKAAGILDLATGVLLRVVKDINNDRAKCEVRIYGGWYEGAEITRLAQELFVQIQEDFPFLLNIPKAGDRKVAVSMTAELAVALLEEPAHHLFNTFRQKGKPANLRVREPQEIGCTNEACILPLVRKVVSSGKCPVDACVVEAENLVYRNEQKIVDAMLTCDLLFVAATNDMTILISSDDDFLPPLRIALLRGANVVRCHPNQNNTRAVFPTIGRQLIELDL